MAPKPNRWFAATPNTVYIYKSLTDGTVTKMTGGRIPQMSPKQAAGLVGSWIIETGRKGLENLDVVEKGSGRGRGLSQYTGVRRTPYDQAASAARAAGKDPNSAQWQLEYFAKEYMNNDLIGWTRVFEKAPTNLKSAADYARYYTGSAAEGKGYFRPGTPHWDRRMQAAEEVFRHYTGQESPKRSAPKQQAPVQPYDPLKSVKKAFGLQSSLAGGLSISPVKPVTLTISPAADYLNSIKAWKSDFNALPGLEEIANASIGITKNISSKTNQYGSNAYSSSFGSQVASINNRSYGGSMNLGGSLGISNSSAYRAVTNSGVSYPGSSFGSSWGGGFSRLYG